MGEVIGKIEMKHVERARNERRFLYVDWKSGNVMLSNASQGGGHALSAEDIRARKVENERVMKERKAIRRKISELRGDAGRAGRDGKANRVESIVAEISQLTTKYVSLRKKPIPKR